MQCVILAGGVGSRLSEETETKPKPMVEIGGRPILWHIMKIYSHYGINHFIICLGYKGYIIKEYFLNYYHHLSDITVDLSNNSTHIHNNRSEPWKITLVDTGLNTMTGGRLKRVQPYIENEDFCFTYGDGLADVNICNLIEAHHASLCPVTITAVQPPGRFGVIQSKGNRVLSFQEKPKGDDSWINGGFMVLSSEVFDYVTGESTSWEQEPMRKLANEGKVQAYFHQGFWQPMDTLRDKNQLENLWKQGAPWKIWDNQVCLAGL